MKLVNLTNRSFHVFIAFILITSSFSYASSPVNMQPGLWLIGTALYAQDGTRLIPMSNKQFCYTREDLDILERDQITLPHPEASSGGLQKDDGCEISDYKHVGDKITWGQRCEKTVNFPNEKREFLPTTFISLDDGRGECNYKGDAFSCSLIYISYIEPGSQGAPHKQYFIGKRIGNCR